MSSSRKKTISRILSIRVNKIKDTNLYDIFNNLIFGVIDVKMKRINRFFMMVFVKQTFVFSFRLSENIIYYIDYHAEPLEFSF